LLLILTRKRGGEKSRVLSNHGWGDCRTEHCVCVLDHHGRVLSTAATHIHIHVHVNQRRDCNRRLSRLGGLVSVIHMEPVGCDWGAHCCPKQRWGIRLSPGWLRSIGGLGSRGTTKGWELDMTLVCHRTACSLSVRLCPDRGKEVETETVQIVSLLKQTCKKWWHKHSWNIYYFWRLFFCPVPALLGEYRPQTRSSRSFAWWYQPPSWAYCLCLWFLYIKRQSVSIHSRVGLTE